jgi:flagellar motor switch protein FliN/FliY
MADEMENIENMGNADEGQISEDDWAAAMAEQAITDDVPAAAMEAQPANIFPSFGGLAATAA